MIKPKAGEELVFGLQSSKKKSKPRKRKCQPVVHTEPAGSYKRSTGLHDLPVELLYEILLFSLNPSFTLVSQHMHLVFKSTGPHFRADYIIKAAGPSDEQEMDYLRAWWKYKLSAWLRYGICDSVVLQLLISRTRPPKTIGTWDNGINIDKVELPKHILRSFSRTSSEGEEARSVREAAAMAFLRYLLGPIELPGPCPAEGSQPNQPLNVTQYGDPNSHRGYFLARAVHLNHEPLVDLLLAHGASPLQKEGVAVKFAIGRKDERMVRKLIAKCRPSNHQFTTVGEELLKYSVKVDARDIAYFFIREQRVAPSLETLKLLR
ncbi:hypothetical protein M407DRAFT_88208 [Tulasnella calospora MUT 4182]|uniref:F-box domain-containing protein n=1 Tax=Tulasnella calospora MUT 4182 TaxID=1051891 RepID=A0A0C3QN50_9AGAM|nr:hypothetical protein M407DRAFT_88208 [Tulasnella calospora MUT 4182]